ncbi:unnamed protein product [Allacma fusca]|uniref:Nodulin-like domain-containing protein n=1 Tax=Allacma fusca TaxID=39272 RepID=A0A8J2JYQ2_9HEXA|nr:unnamed protein product [Allacma fusca]
MLYVLVGAIGLGSGGFSVAQAAWIIDIWRQEAAPFILTINFAYSSGTLIPPLILGPYLKGKTEETDGTAKFPYEFNLQIPFTIGGAIACFAIIIQAFLYVFVFRQSNSSMLAFIKPWKYARHSSFRHSPIFRKLVCLRRKGLISHSDCKWDLPLGGCLEFYLF